MITPLIGIGLGLPELFVILLVVLIVFGVGKLPEIGSGLGKAIREFKKATKETQEIDVTEESKKISKSENSASEAKQD